MRSKDIKDMKEKTAGFCLNSRRWIDFVFIDLNLCPHEMRCENCDYYQMRKVTKWYIYKKKVLKSFC